METPVSPNELAEIMRRLDAEEQAILEAAKMGWIKEIKQDGNPS
jgi:hypothetical protein